MKSAWQSWLGLGVLGVLGMTGVAGAANAKPAGVLEVRVQGGKLKVPVVQGWSWSDSCGNVLKPCMRGRWTGAGDAVGTGFMTSVNHSAQTAVTIETTCKKTFEVLSRNPAAKATDYRFRAGPGLAQCSWKLGGQSPQQVQYQAQYMMRAGQVLMSFSFIEGRPSAQSQGAFATSIAQTMEALSYE